MTDFSTSFRYVENRLIFDFKVTSGWNRFYSDNYREVHNADYTHGVSYNNMKLKRMMFKIALDNCKRNKHKNKI